MKKPCSNLYSEQAGQPGCTKMRAKLLPTGLAAILSVLTAVCASAVTVTVSPITLNYWGGVNTINTLGLGSNVVTFASADTTTNNLSVTGVPAGSGATLTPNALTNTALSALSISLTNAPAGTYPLTITASGNASYATNVNLFVVPQW